MGDARRDGVPRVGTAYAVGLASLLGVALRLPFITGPLEPDEAGYLLVADQWHLLDGHLYGHFWVDRPPLLLLLFQVADAWGPYGVRLVGAIAVGLLALAAGAAGSLVAGRRGGVAASLVAGALASSFAIGGQEVDGELLAAPLVMTCCASTVAAWRATARAPVLAVLAGVTGASALLVKQNMADGLVFAGALVLMTAVARDRARALRLLSWGAAGTASVLGGILTWALVSGVGLGSVAYAMYGFRVAADEVISEGTLDQPLRRVATLVAAALVSGLALLLVQVLRQIRPALARRDPPAVAVALTLTFGLVSVSVGGSYWRHYLVQLVPMLALGSAMVIGHRSTRRLVTGVVASAVVATAVGVGVGWRTGGPEASATTTGHYLRDASRPGDDVVVTYGHANLVAVSGLASPYPYLWSLPTRVRDPHLDRLRRLLTGPEAPTWIVEWDDFDSWGIDADGRLASAVRAHYRPVTSVCAHQVWLHEGRLRGPPPEVRGPCDPD